jgi:hypothetical protein
VSVSRMLEMGSMARYDVGSERRASSTTPSVTASRMGSTENAAVMKTSSVMPIAVHGSERHREPALAGECVGLGVGAVRDDARELERDNAV